MVKNYFSLLISFFFAIALQGQVITVDPVVPQTDELVTVTLHTEGTQLEDYTGDIYAHTGLTANGERWQYVIESWGNNDTQPKLTKVGDNTYEFIITPSIREFYGVNEGDFITEICMVFRSESEPWLQTSPDIFYPVADDALSVTITTPDVPVVIVPLGETLNVEWIATNADSSWLYVDNQLVFADTGVSFQYEIDINEEGKKWVRAVASDGMEMVSDSFYYYVRSAPEYATVPDGIQNGINYLDEDVVVLCLYAPQKEFVFVLGDFNDWEIGDDGYMKVDTAANRFWIELTDIVPMQEYAYQYFVDGELRVSDPYTEKILDPWNDQYIPEETYPNLKPYPHDKTDGLVAIFQTNQPEYQWQNTNFERPAITDLVVYELLVRDFIAARNYQTLIDTLNYLKTLGVNAIELMPINEFDGNLSWGYNPNHYFAVDKFYGTRADFKEFVDVCHGEGIAVILDVVYNHATGISPYVALYYNQELNRPADDSPFYNEIPKHDFNVFADMNHEFEGSKEYIKRAIKFWLEEYHVDGYRLDLSKGLTQKNTLGDVGAWGQYDQSRVDILNDYAAAAWEVNPETYFILEHFADNSEEKVLSADGMMLWGNLNHSYSEASMGYIPGSDFSWISYQKRGWDAPHVVGYMESHDEERLMYKNVTYGKVNDATGYSTKDTTTALRRMALVANFFFTIPGPKMMWQFGEMGYDYSIDYNGRTGEKPIRWDYLDDWRRKNLVNIYGALIELRKEYDVFRTTDYDLDVGGAMKRIKLNGEDMDVVVLGNFDVEDGSIDPEFFSTGTWYEFWTGDSLIVTDVNAPIELVAGEYRIYTDKKLDSPDFVGIGENQIEDVVADFVVYPNPANESVNVSLDLKDAAEMTLAIFDMQGRKVQEFNQGKLQRGQQTFSYNIDQLEQGIYLIVIRAGRQQTTQKLFVR